MKKIVRISSILFVATPLMLLNSSKVEAAQVASIQSNADITFALDNTVTPPVNPTNPSQPVTPNPADPHQPGTAGPLVLTMFQISILDQNKFKPEQRSIRHNWIKCKIVLAI